ncbi:uncharacterized protein PITG_03069 [Phytophthora infestans T30-4]|uniref:Uncharacterized protein n=1 Tax=Phytophthora infestans (strain T30-4) TaxID=403677 RepID=D0MZA8_PHYIT|nr:uncharacterized protein PITG_03069 [Phytophthora infestans T30-4]EEY65571.1 hypothetical protein PITG_03069 [Phytophthora infestans T30-4]|eukprot:XP_002906170.1 hypothetical protein PITG_03069 [Phytophthora infestans T30-4]
MPQPRRAQKRRLSADDVEDGSDSQASNDSTYKWRGNRGKTTETATSTDLSIADEYHGD